MIYRQEPNLAVIGIAIDNYRYRHRLRPFLEIRDMSTKFFCIIDCNTLPINRYDDEFPYDEVRLLSAAAAEQGLEFSVIFENLHEAPSYLYDLKKYVDTICKQNHIPIEKIIIVSGAQHQFDQPVVNCWTPMMSTSENLMMDNCVETIPNHHFISLARIAKPHRVMATVEIWDRQLDQFGYLSLGSGYYMAQGENEAGRDLIPKRYQDRFPALLDGLIAPGHLDDKQHRASDPRMTEAFVNLAMETAYDRSISPNIWNVPFISEKSVKPFTWGQVPLLLAPQNSIPKLRELGFDMFDDVINHRYDEEPDPERRIQKVIIQLEKICNQPIEHYREFKRYNMHRFLHNRACAWDLHMNKKWQITQSNLDAALGLDKVISPAV